MRIASSVAVALLATFSCAELACAQFAPPPSTRAWTLCFDGPTVTCNQARVSTTPTLSQDGSWSGTNVVADLRNLQGTDQRVNAFASALTSWTFFYMTPDDQGSTSPNTAMGGGKQFITAMNGAQTPAAPRSPWTYAGNSRSDRLGGWAYSSQIYLVSDLSWLTGIAGIGPAYADWIAGCTLPDASVGIAFGFTGTTSTCGLGYFSLSFWTPALLDVQLVRGMVINEFFRTDAAPYVAGDNKFRNCFAPTSGAPGDGEDGLGATIGVCRAVEISSAEFVGGSSSTIPEPATGVLSVMGAMAVFGLRSMRSKGRS